MDIYPFPPEVDDKKNALREKVLTNSYEEYKELMAAWRNLDTKAQGTVAIAGIFIAGALAYLTKGEGPPPTHERVLFFLAALFLLGSIAFSLHVLWIRDAPSPCLGRSVKVAVGDLMLLPTSQGFINYYPLLYETLAERWEVVNSQLVTSNKSKGDSLLVAQVWLVLAILCAVALVILKVSQ